MRRYLLSILAGLALLLAGGSVRAGEQDLLTITHYSESLGREKTFQVYVPESEEPDARFPVLFVLHGAYGSYEDWTTRTQAPALADAYNMILVFPDGDPFGWYLDSPVEKESQLETYVAVELVSEVDRLFPTVGTREARGIMGLSMGGHGAFLLAAKHPETFGSASALSAIMRISNHPDKWHISGRLGEFEENKADWIANSVWDQAERFVDANVRLMFDCGEDDTSTGAILDSRELHTRLMEIGVPHIWREHTGTHSWSYWEEHLEEHLNFHQAAMIESGTEKGRWHTFYFKRMKQFFDENAAWTIADRPTEPVVCLLGSSSVQGFPSELLPEFHVINRGITADTLGIGTRGISHRLESSVFDFQPDIVAILNGRNDLGNRHRSGEPSIRRMVEEYRSIVETIRARLPEARLFIVTCPPVRDKYAHLKTSTYSYNKELAVLASDLELEWIDLHAALVDEEGLLAEEYSHDGLHLNDTGEDVWASLMLEAFKAPQPE